MGTGVMDTGKRTRKLARITEISHDTASHVATSDAASLFGAGLDDPPEAIVDFRARWFGPGAFHQPGPLGVSGAAPFFVAGTPRRFACLTHPSAAFTGHRTTAPAIASDFGGGDTTTTAKKKNPPPTTKPGNVAVKILPPAGVACDISVEVLADVVDKDATADGETKCRWKDDRTIDPPVVVYDNSSGLSMVSDVTKGAKAKAVLLIQTTYSKQGAEYMISGYGRGTTADDLKAGNITLGFHESCHRDDFIRYLNTQKLPSFDGTAGMVGQDFLDDWSAFMSAFLKLPDTIGAWSKALTDDVGVTQAAWKARGNKKSTPAASKH